MLYVDVSFMDSKFTAHLSSLFSLRTTPMITDRQLHNQRPMINDHRPKTFHVALPSPVVPRFGPLWSLCPTSVWVCVCLFVLLCMSVQQYMYKCCRERGVRVCVCVCMCLLHISPESDQLSFTVSKCHSVCECVSICVFSVNCVAMSITQTWNNHFKHLSVSI